MTLSISRSKAIRRGKNPRLIVEEYNAKEERLKTIRYIYPRDADATKENINDICQKWIRYISKFISLLELIVLQTL